VSFFNITINHIRANETCTTGNQYFHRKSPAIFNLLFSALRPFLVFPTLLNAIIKRS
jgi:hypothetical protein